MEYISFILGNQDASFLQHFGKPEGKVLWLTKIGMCRDGELKNKVFVLRQGRFGNWGRAGHEVCPASIPGFNAARE